MNQPDPHPHAASPAAPGPGSCTAPGDLHGGFRPRSFSPASWLLGPDLQTVVGKALRSRSLVLEPDTSPGGPRLKQRLETPDGDFLDLEVAPDPGPGRPIVLVLHGLEGSTRRGYMRMAFRALSRQGLLAVGMNFRSCSGVPNRLPRFYHSGETGDVALVLEWIRRRFPGRPVGALGFSLGGNVLLRLLAAEGKGVDAAAVISVPFDLAAGTRQLERSPMGRLYTRYFLRSLLGKVRAKEHLLAPCLSLEGVFRARTLREFDDLATAPLHGFSSAWEYYRQASSGPVLDRIRRPTLVLHSRDDPFLPPDTVPETALLRNPWLLGAIAERGGHVAFVENSMPLRPRFWAEAEAARYLAHLLDGGVARMA